MADFGGGLGGAASGAAVGSAFGPVGAAIGGVAGGLLGLFGRKKKKPKRLSTLNKDQEALMNKYSQGVQGQGPLSGLFDYNPQDTRDVFTKTYAQPAYQQYQENIVPGITGQFRGGNLQNSSYLAGALSKAGVDVQRNLDAQLSNMIYQGQQDSVNRRINAINNILGTQTFAYQKPQQTAGQQAFSSLMDVGGKSAGSYFDRMFNPTPSGANISTPGGG